MLHQIAYTLLTLSWLPDLFPTYFGIPPPPSNCYLAAVKQTQCTFNRTLCNTWETIHFQWQKDSYMSPIRHWCQETMSSFGDTQPSRGCNIELENKLHYNVEMVLMCNVGSRKSFAKLLWVKGAASLLNSNYSRTQGPWLNSGKLMCNVGVDHGPWVWLQLLWMVLRRPAAPLTHKSLTKLFLDPTLHISLPEFNHDPWVWL